MSPLQAELFPHLSRDPRPESPRGVGAGVTAPIWGTKAYLFPGEDNRADGISMTTAQSLRPALRAHLLLPHLILDGSIFCPVTV